jgi:hypothetical protein
VPHGARPPLRGLLAGVTSALACLLVRQGEKRLTGMREFVGLVSLRLRVGFSALRAVPLTALWAVPLTARRISPPHVYAQQQRVS